MTSTDRDVAGGERGAGLVSALLPVWTSDCEGIKVLQRVETVDCCCQRCREWTLKIERPRSAWREEAKRLEAYTQRSNDFLLVKLSTVINVL